MVTGIPCGSDCKESACNVGHPGSIPGLGRSPGEGNGNSYIPTWEQLHIHTHTHTHTQFIQKERNSRYKEKFSDIYMPKRCQSFSVGSASMSVS